MGGKFVLNGKEYMGGKSAPYKEVTLSEYNALPASKLTDGMAYYIKDLGNPYSYPPLIYSDEEREVGVWRDGKPLYQRTFIKTVNISDSSGGTQLLDLDIYSVVSEYIRIEASLYGTVIMPRNRIKSTWSESVYCSDDKIYFEAAHQVSNAKLYVTVLYTKSSDTAGSGIWTTQGGFAHHYSTNEKIIGTWIDGKPIYEKTVDCGYLPNNSALSFSHGISNLKRIVSHEGGAINSSGTYLPLPKVSPAGLQYSVDVAVTLTDIVISTGTDRTDYYAYITLRYTKTTD